MCMTWHRHRPCQALVSQLWQLWQVERDLGLTIIPGGVDLVALADAARRRASTAWASGNPRRPFRESDGSSPQRKNKCGEGPPAGPQSLQAFLPGPSSAT